MQQILDFYTRVAAMTSRETLKPDFDLYDVPATVRNAVLNRDEAL